MRETVQIGDIEAWLYRPEKPPRAVVTMAPGLCGTKAGPLERFADGFVRAGYAVLLFDLRCFGGSGGAPRHMVDPLMQIADYRSAIAFARGLNLPIVLWGTSFSANAALCAAAEETAIAAAVAQVPWLGGEPVHPPSRLDMLRYVSLSLLDTIGAALGFRAITIRAYGRPGERAFAQSAQNFDHPFWRDVPPFENKMAVRGLKHLDAAKARDVFARVRCPVLLMAAMQDDMVRFDEVRTAALPGCGGRFVQFDCGHFDLYVPPLFERNLRAQIEFLDAIVGYDSPS